MVSQCSPSYFKSPVILSLSLSLSLYLSIYLTIYLSIYLSLSLSIYLSIYIYIYLHSLYLGPKQATPRESEEGKAETGLETEMWRLRPNRSHENQQNLSEIHR